MNNIYHGDNIEVLKGMPDNSIDSIVTDPPYGLSFMNKHWDYEVPKVGLWKECLRVLKPGGHLLSFAGTRTYHRMTVNIEDAGFEIRDMISWIYGSGFPKSLNIGKVMDKFIKTGNASWNGTGDSSNGALGYSKLQHQQDYRPEDYSNRHQNKAEITETEAIQYNGWGTALKPACEPICVARKPIPTTIAENVLKYGTGGINIDGCRIGLNGDKKVGGFGNGKIGFSGESAKGVEWVENTQGRFPANIIFDEIAGVMLDEVSGEFKGEIGRGNRKSGGNYNATSYKVGIVTKDKITDFGGASRFFYCAKASKAERNGGLEGFEEKIGGGMTGTQDQTLLTGNGNIRNNKMSNHHPTVKPLKLMQYLVRLVTPKGGVCLDPFCGSGTTLMACVKEGFNYIGIEREADYVKIAEARIEWINKQVKEIPKQTNMFKDVI